MPANDPFQQALRRAAGKNRILPGQRLPRTGEAPGRGVTSASNSSGVQRPPLTGVQMFGMTPAQVAAYEGRQLPPAAGVDFGGGNRGATVPTAPRNEMLAALRAAGAAQRESKSMGGYRPTNVKGR